jgi:hypothetical protein
MAPCSQAIRARRIDTVCWLFPTQGQDASGPHSCELLVESITRKPVSIIAPTGLVRIAVSTSLIFD